MSQIIDINVTPTVEQIDITVTENLTTVNVNTVQQSSDPNSVKLTTEQIIYDVKTFDSSPIVPTAWLYNQAVNLGQVIPYTGTPTGQPITGTLETNAEIFLKTNSGEFTDDGGQMRIKHDYGISLENADATVAFLMDGDDIKILAPSNHKGLIATQDLSANNDGTDRKIYPQTGWVQDAILGAVDGVELTANKNQNNGYSGLDSGGKIPLANLPTTLLKYQGVWNASTNTPTLTNPDTTKIGNVYNVSVAGTRFGITWGLGDWLIYNASGVPEKSDNSDDVVSVNGQTGVVTITKSDVGLSNVNNTSDADKPVSTAQQTALDSKLTKSGDTITGDILNTSTGFIEAPSGTTAQRPVSPRNRMFRYNTDTLRFEFYANGAWRNMARLEGDTFTGAITATNLSGTNTGDQNENNVYLSHDFLTTNVNDFISIAAVNSGTSGTNNATVTVNNPGVMRITSSTTANSGVAIRSPSTVFILKGGEVFTEIFNPLLFTNTTLRMGIHDSTSSAIPANGVFFRYSGDGLLTLVTANNSVQTTSATITTLSLNTWYKVRFTVNANATGVLGEVFNNAGVLIASVTNTTNIPTTARFLNVCSIVTNSGTTALALLDVDFMSLKTTLIR